MAPFLRCRAVNWFRTPSFAQHEQHCFTRENDIMCNLIWSGCKVLWNTFPENQFKKCTKLEIWACMIIINMTNFSLLIWLHWDDSSYILLKWHVIFGTCLLGTTLLTFLLLHVVFGGIFLLCTPLCLILFTLQLTFVCSVYTLYQLLL